MGAEISGSEDDLSQPISAINVTPFVDVVLVLLVIFVVTAPMMMKETMNIRLPKSSTSDGKKMTTLSVVVTKSGNVLINGVLAGESEVREAVRSALQTDSETQAVISADKEAFHGDVVRAIDWVKSSGLGRFALQVEREVGE